MRQRHDQRHVPRREVSVRGEWCLCVESGVCVWREMSVVFVCGERCLWCLCVERGECAWRVASMIGVCGEWYLCVERDVCGICV